MQSTLKDADPHDIFAIEPSFAATRPDNAAAPAQAGKAAPGQREPWFGPSLAPSSAPPIASAAAVASVPPVTPTSVAPVPPAMPEYSAASHDGRLDDIRLERAPRPTNKWAIRAFWFLFAIAGAMGTAAWQHYGHRVKQMVAEYVPQVEALTSLLPGKTVAAPDQASPPAAQAAATDQPAEAAPAAAPQDVAAAAPAPAAAPAAAAAPVAPAAPAVPVAGAPDQTQLLQSMARDLASMGQQIEQLKTSIDQLKAGQDQLTQRVARATETRAVEPRPVAPRPRAAITPPTVPHTAVAPPPVRRPAQAYIPPPPPPTSAAPLPAPAVAPQSAVAPRPVPSQQQSSVVDADDGGPVVRPPMPLR
ncbi:hypothetical protein JQ616_10920 [Bradyrhizobium tropiciagri]|uniref:hypothetical protein n=1 Tax=Bradyrhizobium tropiciagri TaxID=312253 RepID=UPI001BAB4596|nr:hypothetical protein [Bradyrhizobium tropiciagri]MBR0895460.1 hypothetical protein [Bradyrhizobium tropiciagri]